MDHMGGLVTDYGVALRTSDIPWVSKQLWAPDAASKSGKYFLYFPARDKNVADTPVGPFVPEENHIPGSCSIDPAVFVNKPGGEQTSEGADGKAYIYFGGLWGGQLQCWVRPTADSDKEKTDANGYIFDDSQSGPQEPSGPGVPALCPRIAQLSDDMRGFVSPAREIQILAPETGKPTAAENHERRFFEAAWLHGYRGLYYLSYSTGDT
ncbi:Xylosidase/arabinosidase [Penicillium alfredii]|uniref:Xylosidase/arabinosidase n=1 Tax=Penicillium alfredii TaxID=1506179 RepID=A0A9W9G9V5_9EURO|nr:Xylosidase/arabinosidase [Penicillium alfredii]KAJ5114543.1 Xylosidase/arabinosidase [Penicillium alfredii]